MRREERSYLVLLDGRRIPVVRAVAMLLAGHGVDPEHGPLAAIETEVWLVPGEDEYRLAYKLLENILEAPDPAQAPGRWRAKGLVEGHILETRTDWIAPKTAGQGSGRN